MRTALAFVLALGACAHHEPQARAPVAPSRLSATLRLGAVMWPTGQAIIYCARRVDDFGKPVGVAGPCRRLEAGETESTKILSWATLGRFDATAPDAVPSSLGGRCRLEIEAGRRLPSPAPARLSWITPTRRAVLEEWTANDLPASIDADAFTLEADFAPEGEWMAILRVAVGLGDGERVVQIAGARMIKVPACD